MTVIPDDLGNPKPWFPVVMSHKEETSKRIISIKCMHDNGGKLGILKDTSNNLVILLSLS